MYKCANYYKNGRVKETALKKKQSEFGNRTPMRFAQRNSFLRGLFYWASQAEFFPGRVQKSSVMQQPL